MVRQTLERHGRIDVLVNNAGIFQRAKLVDTDLETYRRIIDVNQVGVFLGMRAVAPTMIEQQSGSIVNISSVAGLRASPGALAYGASKFAVTGMTKSAAMELVRHGIRVNSIHPGMIETDMMTEVTGGNAERHDKFARVGADAPSGRSRRGGPAGAVPGLRRQRLLHRFGVRHRRRHDGHLTLRSDARRSAGLADGAPVELAGGQLAHRDRRRADPARQPGAGGTRSGRPPAGPCRGGGRGPRRSVVTIRPERNPARISVTRSAHSGGQRASSSWRPGRYGSIRWRNRTSARYTLPTPASTAWSISSPAIGALLRAILAYAGPPSARGRSGSGPSRARMASTSDGLSTAHAVGPRRSVQPDVASQRMRIAPRGGGASPVAGGVLAEQAEVDVHDAVAERREQVLAVGPDVVEHPPVDERGVGEAALRAA